MGRTKQTSRRSADETADKKHDDATDGLPSVDFEPIAKRRKPVFDSEFTNAVNTAYNGSGSTCQLVIADFVGEARRWLLRDPMIEQLNTRFPLFGSHVLTTLTKGPQSPYVQADGKLMSAANNSASALSANPFRAPVEAPSLFMQPFPPKRL